jgi:cysteine desulfurase family protein (TIGR01976 family)
LPDIDAVRREFPGLHGPDVLLDNAGGSQVPRVVADGIRDYYLSTFVQLDAPYETSRRATANVNDAHAFLRTFVGGDGIGEVAVGASTSVLCYMLADCYARALDPKRNEIIVCDAGHEANLSPWVKLEDRGYTIRWWKVDPETAELDLGALRELLSERTRIVAVHHVSNLLGRIEPIPEIAAMAHEHGARVVVDGVAFAPHRAIDVKAWDVDWYVYSTYKVYGPHMAVMFGKHEAWAELHGPNFYFVPDDAVPYKFELGGANHEACAGILALQPYLCFLAGQPDRDTADRAIIEAAFDHMAALELPLLERLLDYLRSKPVRILGPATSSETRVPTISFAANGKSSREIAEAAGEQRLGLRFGHNYAHRLALALGLEPGDGAVRASLVHYNHPDEVDRLIEFLDSAL